MKFILKINEWITLLSNTRWLDPLCGVLAFLGTLTAAFPVTAVVIPATLLVPRHWLWIALSCALGSALGATLLVEMVHSLGLAQLTEWFPHVFAHQDWQQMSAWVDEYGLLSLFIIAATPLPQTPALIFFGLAGHDGWFLTFAMLAGKTLKYGVTAWLASHFPERFELKEKT